MAIEPKRVDISSLSLIRTHVACGYSRVVTEEETEVCSSLLQAVIQYSNEWNNMFSSNLLAMYFEMTSRENNSTQGCLNMVVKL